MNAVKIFKEKPEIFISSPYTDDGYYKKGTDTTELFSVLQNFERVTKYDFVDLRELSLWAIQGQRMFCPNEVEPSFLNDEYAKLSGEWEDTPMIIKGDRVLLKDDMKDITYSISKQVMGRQFATAEGFPVDKMSPLTLAIMHVNMFYNDTYTAGDTIAGNKKPVWITSRAVNNMSRIYGMSPTKPEGMDFGYSQIKKIINGYNVIFWEKTQQSTVIVIDAGSSDIFGLTPAVAVEFSDSGFSPARIAAVLINRNSHQYVTIEELSSTVPYDIEECQRAIRETFINMECLCDVQTSFSDYSYDDLMTLCGFSDSKKLSPYGAKGVLKNIFKKSERYSQTELIKEIVDNFFIPENTTKSHSCHFILRREYGKIIKELLSA